MNFVGIVITIKSQAIYGYEQCRYSYMNDILKFFEFEFLQSVDHDNQKYWQKYQEISIQRKKQGKEERSREKKWKHTQYEFIFFLTHHFIYSKYN